MSKGSHSLLWKTVIAWERARAASGYGIIWGQTRRNLVRNVIAWIVLVTLTELQIAIRSKLLF